MFKDNKYSRWYRSIIAQAQEKVNSRLTGRFEKHHILPKSMGGSDAPENLVKLTPREHWTSGFSISRTPRIALASGTLTKVSIHLPSDGDSLSYRSTGK